MSVQQGSFDGGAITAKFLVQAGQVTPGDRDFSADQLAQAADIGDVLADFISAAKTSIHMAIYDFRLQGDAANKVVGALNAAAQAGRDVRIAYFEAPKQPTPEAFAFLGSDPAVVNDGMAGADLNASVGVKGIKENTSDSTLAPPVSAEAIEPPHNLMHSKYIIRDGMSDGAAVLMGSANFTTDAWALQDNNILIFDKCQQLSAYYENDFGEMWQSGLISNTGNFDTASVTVGTTSVDVMFAPGRGRQIGAEIASRIATAQKRLLIASMVISSGPIMGAIVDRMHRVETFGGIFDGPEMRMVLHEWDRSTSNENSGSQSSAASRRRAASGAKAQQFQQIAEFLHYKKSLPFTAQGLHNFMHNKFAVVDDTVITGSFNFSTNAQSNAENMVIIGNAQLADAYAAFAHALMEAYPDTGVPE
jgi:phosphatidylserine/phosphatidylglycerophosphate/cardiolipin synthase-like enzyme